MVGDELELDTGLIKRLDCVRKENSEAIGIEMVLLVVVFRDGSDVKVVVTENTELVDELEPF